MRFVIYLLAMAAGLTALPARATSFIEYAASGPGAFIYFENGRQISLPAHLYVWVRVPLDQGRSVYCGLGSCDLLNNTIEYSGPVGSVVIGFSSRQYDWPTSNADFAWGTGLFDSWLYGREGLGYADFTGFSVRRYEDDYHTEGSIAWRLTLPVPEPATWAMMLIGFAAAGVALRRQTTLYSNGS